MANIKQQRKRVKIASRERLENLQYKSRIKTMFKTLSLAAAEDKDKAQQLALELIALIDRAAGRGVLHANNAARKKSRVTAIIQLAEGVSKPAGPATTEPKSGKSKADSRVERTAAKRSKKEETNKKQAVRAEAAAKAGKKASEAPSDSTPAAEAPPAGGGAAAKQAEAEAETQGQVEAESSEAEAPSETSGQAGEPAGTAAETPEKADGEGE